MVTLAAPPASPATTPDDATSPVLVCVLAEVVGVAAWLGLATVLTSAPLVAKAVRALPPLTGLPCDACVGVGMGVGGCGVRRVAAAVTC